MTESLSPCYLVTKWLSFSTCINVIDRVRILLKAIFVVVCQDILEQLMLLHNLYAGAKMSTIREGVRGVPSFKKNILQGSYMCKNVRAKNFQSIEFFSIQFLLQTDNELLVPEIAKKIGSHPVLFRDKACGKLY